MSFGKNLERIRKDRKVSQAALGIELGLTQQMISSYEKGTSSPNVEILIKIADYFNVSIDTLVGYVPKKLNITSAEARFLRYFETLNELDREKCIMIAQTLIQDRELK
ncbi:DNA-binding XRE family transcriptional regulator [Mobilisporobacter senegalensis]|uniref:DNA-binding XRE family transcriptional regulator n=1 Tax=Mobilisporobacter senegalensis TaxID=1329262 RepID=A0A3N1XZ65_9FIRM|nr:helix-turn-helix transcriptional regulator [Mobilisporobacter senegalensis]ROR31869.1 DNA-binding XRE family transcriptional regulator [Mobilisporobacter senegalensis]